MASRSVLASQRHLRNIACKSTPSSLRVEGKVPVTFSSRRPGRSNGPLNVSDTLFNKNFVHTRSMSSLGFLSSTLQYDKKRQSKGLHKHFQRTLSEISKEEKNEVHFQQQVTHDHDSEAVDKLLDSSRSSLLSYKFDMSKLIRYDHICQDDFAPAKDDYNNASKGLTYFDISDKAAPNSSSKEICKSKELAESDKELLKKAKNDEKYWLHMYENQDPTDNTVYPEAFKSHDEMAVEDPVESYLDLQDK